MLLDYDASDKVFSRAHEIINRMEKRSPPRIPNLPPNVTPSQHKQVKPVKLLQHRKQPEPHFIARHLEQRKLPKPTQDQPELHELTA